MSCAVIRVYHMVQVFFPNMIFGSLQGPKHAQECPVESLYLTVPLGMIGGRRRMFHATQFLELLMANNMVSGLCMF